MTATATEATGRPVVILKRAGRVRSFFSNLWDKIVSRGRKTWSWITRNSKSVARGVARTGRAAWGGAALAARWTGSRLALAGRFAWHWGTRGVGYAGAAVIGAVSWVADGLIWLATNATVGAMLAILGVILVIAWIFTKVDKYGYGSFRWMSLKDRPGYRRYLNNRDAYKPVKIKRTVPVPQDGDIVVTTEHVNDPAPTRSASPGATVPATATMPLTAREIAVINAGHYAWVKQMMDHLDAQGVHVRYYMDEVGTITIDAVEVNEQILDLELNDWLADFSRPLLKEVLEQMLETVPSDTAEGKKYRAYVIGRLRAMSQAETDPAAIAADDRRRKVWSQFWNELKGNQAEFPHNMVRKGFDDMAQEIKDSVLIVGVASE